MVDNGGLEVRKTDDIEQQETEITCCYSSSCSASTQGHLSVAGAANTGHCDGVIDDKDDILVCAATAADESDVLRQIVIDGSNIAMSHGNRTTFSCRGIQLAVDWFRQRGHKKITVFVPQWRRESHKQECTVTDPKVMFELEQEKILVFTPSRKIRGKRIVCHDDRYIVKWAAETGGVIVSNDNYRDLSNENEEFRKAIEERLLMYSFVNDRFMPPDDPLGRHGPSLDDFLRKDPPMTELQPPICPYAKCTYGAKCKYSHPAERVSFYRRPSFSSESGDKSTASGTDCRDSSGNSATSCRKEKLTSGGRSYDRPKQNPENKHLYVKPFDSDPTSSSRCGHLALARKLSNEYKSKPRPNTDSSIPSKGLGNVQNDDTAYVGPPSKHHQQLRRQFAIGGHNDPRADRLGRTDNVNYGVEQDTFGTWTVDLSGNIPTSATEVSPCSGFTETVIQIDAERSLSSRTSYANQIMPEFSLLSLSSDPQQFVTARNGPLQSDVRFTPPSLAASTTACADNVGQYAICPVVFPSHLHSYTQFSAPQLVPRIHLSPGWPRLFVHQSPSYLPQNERLIASVVGNRYFLRR